ncbi:MAG: hypothetical protein IPK77_11420 [Cellvibrio sp.]|nr:hypothetical protein [Cellvibrio sp.]
MKETEIYSENDQSKNFALEESEAERQETDASNPESDEPVSVLTNLSKQTANKVIESVTDMPIKPLFELSNLDTAPIVY